MAELKYIIFFAAFLFGVPQGILLANRFKIFERFMVYFIVFSTVMPDSTAINFVSREFYFAMTKGFEISLADLGALVLLGVMVLQRDKYRIRGLPPIGWAMLGVIAVGFLSWVTSPMGISVPTAAQEHPFFIPYDTFETKFYPLFEISKLIRGFLLFFVIAWYVRQKENLETLLFAIAAATIYIGYLALVDRYVYGFHRIKATLQHPNSLATYMAMVGSFNFASLLTAKSGGRTALYFFAVAMSGVTVLMTISRGGLAALVLGLAMCFGLLIWSNLTLKNVAIILLGLVGATIAVSQALDSLLTRFVGEQDAASDMEYRMYYNHQAELMAKDKIFGVGLGNFSAFSWDGYAALVDPDNPAGTPAHNVWYLQLGEAGVIGLIAFALMWLRYFSLAIPLAVWRAAGIEKAAAVGALACTAVMHVQAMVQLSYRQTPMFLMLMLCMGIISALTMTWRERRKAGA